MTPTTPAGEQAVQQCAHAAELNHSVHTNIPNRLFEAPNRSVGGLLYIETAGLDHENWCATRFLERSKALQACCRRADCDGVVRDGGHVCYGELRPYELRKGRLEAHGRMTPRYPATLPVHRRRFGYSNKIKG